MPDFLAAHALLPEGWRRDVLVASDEAGQITSVTPDAPRGTARLLRGHVIPGVPNLHSHAFQRAMAGGAERRSPAGQDSFWRETMYRFALTISPEDAEAFGALLYAECLTRCPLDRRWVLIHAPHMNEAVKLGAIAVGCAASSWNWTTSIRPWSAARGTGCSTPGPSARPTGWSAASPWAGGL